jgi:glc operon protein GlcG
MSFKSIFSAGAAAVFCLAIATGAQADHHAKSKRVLTLDLAKAIADGCEAHFAKQTDWRTLNIAIVDDGGNLKLFRRMDNSFLISIDVATLKAGTSASLPFPTRLVGELAYGKDGNPGSLPGIAEIPGVAAFPGGLPIVTSDGQHIGGVGVSGATGDQDEECSQAGLDAVKDQL